MRCTALLRALVGAKALPGTVRICSAYGQYTPVICSFVRLGSWPRACGEPLLHYWVAAGLLNTAVRETRKSYSPGICCRPDAQPAFELVFLTRH